MTPNLSAALRLVVEGDPHNDLPAAIERLAADDQRAVRYLLDAQGKRIDRERRDAAADGGDEVRHAAPGVAMTDRLSSALLLVIDGIAPVFELYAAIAALDPQQRAIFDSLDRAFHRRLDRERREAAVIAGCQAIVEAAENWAAQQETP